MWNRKLLTALCVMLGLTVAAQAELSPRRTTLPMENLARESYLTLKNGQWSAAFSYEYEILEDAFSGSSVVVNSEGSFTLNSTLALDVSYGLSDFITLNTIIPQKYVYNTRKMSTNLSTEEQSIFDPRRGASGLGDVIVMSYWRASFGDLVHFGDEYYPSSFDEYDDYVDGTPSAYAGKRQGPVIAAAFGLRLPTGRTDVTDDFGNRVPDDLQLGSGTLDPILGLLYHQRYFRLSWGMSTMFRISSQENIHRYEWGNEFIGSAYLGYRMNKNLEWVNQINASFLGRDMRNGTPVTNHGSKVVFITPSLIYESTGPLTLQASAQIPLYRTFNEQQLSSDYIINLRTAYRFQH